MATTHTGSSARLHVVGAAVLEGGRCLVARRGPGMSSPGRWEFPGGKREMGEGAECALARELREELELDVEVGEWLGRGECVVDGREIMLDVYACRSAGHPPVAREHDAIRWIGIDEIDHLDWADADVPILPAIRARLRRTEAPAYASPRFDALIAADWSVAPARRAVYVARREGSGWAIHHSEAPGEGWSLSALVTLAEWLRDRIGGGVLIAIDAVLGVPALLARALEARTFHECIDRLARSGGLERESRSPDEWKPERPFFRVPSGDGGLSGFLRAANGRSALYRQVELRLAAKTVFALSGIPGTVGASSRELWKDLGVTSASDRNGGSRLALWPFDGDLAALAATGRVVLAEAYPRAACMVALADRLPSRSTRVAKRALPAREQAMARLEQASWTRDRGVRLDDRLRATSDEHGFDACMTAAGLVRLLLEDCPLACAPVDPLIEGGILCSGGVDLP